MAINKKIVLFVFMCLTVSAAYAKDTITIEKLQHTPATKFDLFLYVLYDRSKCLSGSIPTNRTLRAGACMTTYPQYSGQKKYIALNLLVTEKTPLLNGYEAWTRELKKDAIENILVKTARDMGVYDYDEGARYGVIQESQNIVFPNPDGELKQIEETVSSRVMLILTVNYRGNISKAVLTPGGEISVSLESRIDNDSSNNDEPGVTS